MIDYNIEKQKDKKKKIEIQIEKPSLEKEMHFHYIKPFKQYPTHNLQKFSRNLSASYKRSTISTMTTNTKSLYKEKKKRTIQ